jgi:hypothetical protein
LHQRYGVVGTQRGRNTGEACVGNRSSADAALRAPRRARGNGLADQSPSTPADSRLRDGNRLPKALIAISVGLVVALLVTIYGTFRWGWTWTGYQEPDNASLWGWLHLVLLPVTIALLPLWLRSRQRRKAAWRVGFSFLGLVFAVLVVGGYQRDWGWTGFKGNTLWNWLELFLVPFALPAAIAWATTPPPTAPPVPMPGAEPASAPADRPPTDAGPRTGRLALAHNHPARLVRAHPALTIGVALTIIALLSIAALPPRRGPQRATVAIQTVTVSGRNNWTDTGIHLTKGQPVTITARGQVDHDGPSPSPPVGPDGDPRPALRRFSIVRNAPHAALIGKIIGSTEGHPFQVGSYYHTDSIDQSGLLLLGVNDHGLTNNTGEFTARIDVTTPPHRTD